LQQDKHIELISSPQEVPVGHITAPGRIFYEQGGYRDQRNHVDRTIDWFKNHKVFSILILAGIALSFLYGTVKIILDILSWFK
jgi:hypothetical protein